ncbi:MAG: hypothetical protein ACXV2J_03725 [Actinomycetes bacterium]
MSRELTGASAAVRELSVEALAAGHRDALLRFERDNRRWFARWVPDRGDDYFADFDGRLRPAARRAAGRVGLVRRGRGRLRCGARPCQPR